MTFLAPRSYVESLWRRAAGHGRASERGRPTGAALAHPEAKAGGWEPKLHRDNDNYEHQKYSKPISGTELIGRVSLAAHGGLRARVGKRPANWSSTCSSNPSSSGLR